MKFFMTPGSCSLGIHILLEELELLFEVHMVDLLAGDNRKPEFLAVNPRGSVPTLVPDHGPPLLDFVSIAAWLAAQAPARQLLPDARRASLLELMEYAITVVHGEGFTRIFVAAQRAESAAERAALEHEGRAIVRQGFARLVPMMRGPRYIEEQLTVADAALFYLEFWSDRIDLPLPERCQLHYRTMLERRAVRQVLAEEGYASTLRKYSGSAP
jgi:glutathione S-transferase